MLRSRGVLTAFILLGIAYYAFPSRIPPASEALPEEEGAAVLDEAGSGPNLETLKPNFPRLPVKAVTGREKNPALEKDTISSSRSQARWVAPAGESTNPGAALPDAEEKKRILQAGLAVGGEPNPERDQARLASFVETVEPAIREGLAFIGQASVNLGGRRVEVRSLVNFYNGSRHGEPLEDLKTACWSLQTRIEGIPNLRNFIWGAGCGRNVGENDGNFYVYAEAGEAALEPYLTYFALPLPDQSRSGDFRAYLPAKRRWEKLADWSWRPVASDHEFAQEEAAVREN